MTSPTTNGATPRRLTVNVLSTGHRALDHRVFDKEARALAGAGFSVRIIARHPQHELRDGIELMPLPVGSRRLERFLVAPWRAFRLARRHRAPIVHIHDLELLQICPLLKLLGQPIIIYDVHEDFANLMRRRDWIPAPLRPLARSAVATSESWLARSADVVIGPTQGIIDKFPRHPRAAVYNLPTLAFVERAGLGLLPPAERPFDLVHLGVLSEERLCFLIDVLTALRARRPGTLTRIVGVERSQAARLREAFPEIDVWTEVPYEQVPALVGEARVGLNIHPFLHPHIRLAVPVKVLEYMACGCGVVTSWLPELASLLHDDAKRQMTILESAEPRDYAEAVAHWLEDPGALDAAGSALRDAATTTYCWEAESEKLERLYDDAISEARLA